MEVGGSHSRKKSRRLEVSFISMEVSTTSMDAPTSFIEASNDLHEHKVYIYYRFIGTVTHALPVDLPLVYG